MRTTSKRKKEDILVTTSFQAWVWAQEHLREVVYTVGGIIALALIIWLTIVFQNQSANDALERFGEAMDHYQNGEYAAAIPLFEEVTKKHGGTYAGKKGLYYKASSLYMEGKYEEALEAYEKYLRKAHDDILTPSTMLGIADCKLSLEKYEEAAEYYEKVATRYPQDWIAPAAIHKAGLAYKHLDQLDRAKESFEKITEEYPRSVYNNDATRYIEEIDRLQKKTAKK